MIKSEKERAQPQQANASIENAREAYKAGQLASYPVAEAVEKESTKCASSWGPAMRR